MWKKAQQWEASWWIFENTYGEEEKQILYARHMGLSFFHDGKSPYNVNLGGRAVVDIGGGPTSLLLKCVNKGISVVVDPLPVPAWVKQRYVAAGILYLQTPAEELLIQDMDECWIYNCLQHTRDPELVVHKALSAARVVRVFEWVGTVCNEGHPHAFTESRLNRMFGGQGKVKWIDGLANCYGEAYFGVFNGHA